MSRAAMSDAPLFDAARVYVDARRARFHTPGHKGSPLAPFAGLDAAFDLTELPETDSLFEAQGAILAAERAAAESFGMHETLFSAGGATLCIQAMLRLASQGGRRRVVMARNVHRSAVNASALLGLEPVWVWPHGFTGSSLPGEIRAEDVRKALVSAPDAAAVYLTSPDYYGVLSDIAALAAVCGEFGVPLLVDNAHGAHLLCLAGGKLHPARLGAALTCDSAHKTLPVLTGGAFLQIARGFSREQAKAAMALFGSTSPSYPVMISLDLARAWMRREGEAAFDALAQRVQMLNQLCAGLGFFRAPARFDPARLTVDTASAGVPGDEAAEHLRRAGVEAEMHDDRHVVLLPSPFNTEGDFMALADALKTLPRKKGLPLTPREDAPPAAVMTPRDALNAPGEEAAVEQTAGRVAAECCCPCPPGVPLVMPGERIGENLARALKRYGIAAMKVVK